METYIHKVQYYETDKMGITHHSNYIRWMEEARIDFLSQIGWSYAKMEEEGVISPVLAADIRYKRSTTFSDEIAVAVGVKEFKGVRLILEYVMKDRKDGGIVAAGTTEHCFLNRDSRPVNMKKEFPDLFRLLTALALEGAKQEEKK